MKSRSNIMLRVLQVLSWIIFVGVCIEAGGFIVNAIFTLAAPDKVKFLYQQVDLSALFDHNRLYFFVIVTLMSIVALLRAMLFYFIIKLLHGGELDIARPFSAVTGGFVFKIAYTTLLLGLFSWWGSEFAVWLHTQAVTIPDTRLLRLGGADVWFFMSVTMFVIGYVFKRGIELQAENELTV